MIKTLSELCPGDIIYLSGRGPCVVYSINPDGEGAEVDTSEGLRRYRWGALFLVAVAMVVGVELQSIEVINERC